MQFIDELRAEILLNRRGSSTNSHILILCSILCTLQGGVYSVGNKVERCSAFHLQCFSWMVGQNKRRYVIRWFVTPPSFPLFVRPGAAHRSKHVPAKNP